MPQKVNSELLFFCTQNARLRLKDLTALLKKTPQRLKYNLDQLHQKNIVYNPYAIIDYSFFGQLQFKVYFKGAYISEKHKQEIVDQLGKNPYIVSIYELSGEFDLAVDLQTANPSQFHKEMKNIIALNPTLSDYKVALNVVTHLYPAYYLLLRNVRLLDETNWLSHSDPDIIIGGDRAVEFFSLAEMKVVEQLLLKPQAAIVTLACNAQVHVKTAKKIVHDLQRRKIIKGYRQLLDTNSLEIYKHRLFVKLHHFSSEREDALMEFFRRTPEVVEVHKTVGDWDLEVDVEALEKNKVRYIMMQLREDFRDIIQSFNSLEFYQYYKLSFLPQGLFKGMSG